MRHCQRYKSMKFHNNDRKCRSNCDKLPVAGTKKEEKENGKERFVVGDWPRSGGRRQSSPGSSPLVVFGSEAPATAGDFPGPGGIVGGTHGKSRFAKVFPFFRISPFSRRWRRGKRKSGEGGQASGKDNQSLLTTLHLSTLVSPPITRWGLVPQSLIARPILICHLAHFRDTLRVSQRWNSLFDIFRGWITSLHKNKFSSISLILLLKDLPAPDEPTNHNYYQHVSLSLSLSFSIFLPGKTSFPPSFDTRSVRPGEYPHYH